MALLWKMVCNLGDPMSLGYRVGCRRSVGFLIMWVTFLKLVTSYREIYTHKTFIYVDIYLCRYLCIYAYTYISICNIFIHTYIYRYRYTYIYIYINISIYMYIYIDICLYKNIHIYMYTYI